MLRVVNLGLSSSANTACADRTRLTASDVRYDRCVYVGAYACACFEVCVRERGGEDRERALARVSVCVRGRGRVTFDVDLFSLRQKPFALSHFLIKGTE